MVVVAEAIQHKEIGKTLDCIVERAVENRTGSVNYAERTAEASHNYVGLEVEGGPWFPEAEN